MESIESLNLSLSRHEESRRLISAALLKANETLVTAKIGQRGRIKDSIRNYEQELKRVGKLIEDTNKAITRLNRSEDKRDTKVSAYEKGIDPNAAWAQAIASGVGSVTNAITSIGTGGMGSLATKKDVEPTPPGVNADPFAGTPAEKKPMDGMIMYLVIGAVVLFMLFKKK
jgi:hypothetical protein